MPSRAGRTPETGTALAGGQSPERYRALPAQHGMILNSLRFPGDGVDLVQVTLDWPAPLQPAPFEAAWRDAVRRHPILRTGFQLTDEDAITGVADPDAALDIRWRDLPPTPAAGTTGTTGPGRPLEAFLLADRREGFDLTRPPLLRLTILGRRRSGQARRAVLTFHHALLDGRALRLLVGEVSAAYQAGLAGQAASHPARPQFRDYLRWWPVAGLAAQRFWTGYLADPVLPRSLPGYLGRHPLPGGAEPMTLELVLPRADSDMVRRTAQAAGLKSSTMVSAAWALLRARYGGVSDVVIAVARSGRHGMPGADEIIGPLINTVLLRIRFEPDWTVRDLLAAADESIDQIRAHQLTPLASILAWAGLPADSSLADSLLMFERRRLTADLPLGPASPVSARLDRLPSYPLTLCAFDEPQLHLALVSDRCRFAGGSAERILDQLGAILLELTRPATPLASLPRASADEAAARAGWNRTPARYPRDATLPALFAAQAATRPDAIAIAWAAGARSYANLDQRSNALAQVLRRHGARTDTPVAVALPRGAALITALLAILKAGAAYLPVDPASPPTRTAAMITTAGAELLLADEQTEAAVPELDGVTVIRAAGLHAGASGPVPATAHPLSLAYISFTSGSTGTPKGVAVPHRAVVRLVSEPTFGRLGPGERIAALAPVAFDASTLEIWGALATGATLVLPPPGQLSLPDIAALLRAAGVTVAWLTAGLFHQLADTETTTLAGIRLLLAGGDVLNPDTVRAVLAARGGRPLVNGYGPTENTTFTTCHVLTEPGQVGPTVPIGRPIQHTTVHILDPAGQPVPIGVAGELYAGGDGLARGYIGHAGATARAFRPDPYQPGGRLYRTGDLARWLADGTIEFLGRLDEQVKIRGYRVEPGEVEAILRAHPWVRDSAVVTAGEGGQRHLLGYVTPAPDADRAAMAPALLREFAAARLPEYLVPTGFAVLDRLPLTANGKIDRAALPEPDWLASAGSEPASPPLPGTEQRLACLWRQLLPGGIAARGPGTSAAAGSDGAARDGASQDRASQDRASQDGASRHGGISREDSFFALGGNSLSAARLMFRIRATFGVDLHVGTFYQAPTLVACAAAIDAAQLAAGTTQPAAGTTQPAAGTTQAAAGTTHAAAGRTPAAAARADQPAAAHRHRAAGHQTDLTVISRRPRQAYLVEPDRAGPHLVRLTDDWALWRTVCLRAAGLPVHLVTALGDTALAAAADAANAAAGNAAAGNAAGQIRPGPAAAASGPAEAGYAAAYEAAVRRLSAVLYQAAGHPAVREAVAWQNRHALATGIDALRRHGAEPARRNTKHRQHEALVASYLQRYCAKNDTIGFFGPVSWARLEDGPGIRIDPAPAGKSLTARVTYLEGWAVRAVMAGHRDALRPWLVPRPMPFVAIDGGRLRVPLAPPLPLTPAQEAVLRACDGSRDARAVAAAVLADPVAGAAGISNHAAVFALLAQLSDSRRLAWQVDVAPQDIRPERSVRALLSRVTDDAVRGPAEAALDRLTAARDELAGAAGDADRVATAMARLESAFTGLAGAMPTRRAGGLYAGRTLAYEECLRGGTVRLGTGALDHVRAALGLVLDSARWYAAASAELYARHFEEIYRQRAAALGTTAIPFADFWLIANNALFDQPPQLIRPVQRMLQQRWQAVLSLAGFAPAGEAPAGLRQIAVSAADLAAQVREQFPASQPRWPLAVHHSPDLMIADADAAAGGRIAWVLGELHASMVTSRYASWLEFHPDPAAVRAALRHDLGGSTVLVAETAEEGGIASRLSNAAASADDVRLIFAHDSCGYRPASTVTVGDCDLTDSPAGLRVRRRAGGFERGLLEVVGDLLSAAVANTFRLLPAAPHQPRVTIDDLVVSRESWTMAAAEPAFAETADESARYRQARAWAGAHGLPRYVFLRFTGEAKPIYADLTSLASVDLIARGLRRCRRAARPGGPGGPGGTVTVVEMLPAPDQAWLTDADGHRFSAELRLVAVDQNRGR